MFQIDFAGVTGLITALGVFIMAVAQAFSIIQNARMKAQIISNTEGVAVVAKKVEEVVKSQDGQFSEMKGLIASKARLEGVREGQEGERANPLVPAAVTIKDASAPAIPAAASMP